VQPALGGGGEDRHVGADLGDDVLGADDPDAVELVQLPDLVQVRLGQRLDLGELADLGGAVVDGDQHYRQHSGVLIGEEGAFQCLLQPADPAAHRAAGQLGQGPGSRAGLHSADSRNLLHKSGPRSGTVCIGSFSCVLTRR